MFAGKTLICSELILHDPPLTGCVNFAGVGYDDATSAQEKEDDAVVPGGYYRYVWDILPADGPTITDPDCLTYSYSSQVDVVRDVNSGLIGAFLVCKAGQACRLLSCLLRPLRHIETSNCSLDITMQVLLQVMAIKKSQSTSYFLLCLMNRGAGTGNRECHWKDSRRPNRKNCITPSMDTSTPPYQVYPPFMFKAICKFDHCYLYSQYNNVY